VSSLSVAGPSVQTIFVRMISIFDSRFLIVISPVLCVLKQKARFDDETSSRAASIQNLKAEIQNQAM
jgi:hypothetical protein